MSDAPKEPSTILQTAKKAGLATLIAASVPLVGYGVHLYESHLESQKIQAEIELEQRKFDVQEREARNSDLKEYVPKLLSDEEDSRTLAVAMITVLHPEEASGILSTVSQSLREEESPSEADLLSLYGSGNIEEGYEAAVKDGEEEAYVKALAGQSPVLSVRTSETLKQDTASYLEQRAEAVKDLPHHTWYVILASGSQSKIQDLQVEQGQIHQGEGGTHYLALGPYPSRDVAQRALISVRHRVPMLTPYLSRPLW